LLDESFNLEISNSTDEDTIIEKFIKDVIASFPEAISKDLIYHCFDSIQPTSRKMSKIKATMRKVGVIIDSSSKSRAPEKIQYMKEAPKYNLIHLIRSAQDADKIKNKY
jgi:hypothetical protein